MGAGVKPYTGEYDTTDIHIWSHPYSAACQSADSFRIWYIRILCRLQEGKRGNSFSGIAKSIYSDSHEMPNFSCRCQREELAHWELHYTVRMKFIWGLHKLDMIAWSQKQYITYLRTPGYQNAPSPDPCCSLHSMYMPQSMLVNLSPND